MSKFQEYRSGGFMKVDDNSGCYMIVADYGEEPRDATIINIAVYIEGTEFDAKSVLSVPVVLLRQTDDHESVYHSAH